MSSNGKRQKNGSRSKNGSGRTPFTAMVRRSSRPAKAKSEALDLGALFAGCSLVVVGGTGFLGKVWWSFLLSRYPGLGRIYLVVRPKDGQSADDRFWKDIAKSEVLVPLRQQHSSGFDDFLRDKVVPVSGDVTKPLCGLEASVRDELRGKVAAVVNAAGVVDFDPPLDEALEVNAFGVQNLVALAHDLGDAPLLHTSTCYVAGNRTGHVEETDPRDFPFPRADELERSHWDPDREISECLDVIRQARHRASDAFRQSRFLDEAKRRLRERSEPARGAVLNDEVRRVKRDFVEARLSEMGMERAQFWGFPNTYTYTKAIGEQIVARSGLAFAIVRPSVVESTVNYPFPSWNEGINTSAPLIFIVRQGGLQIPGADNFLDVIPCDMVAGALTVALGELLEGNAKPVYQAASSDTNPCTMRRFFELTGLYKRKYYQKTGKGGPLVNFWQSHFEGALLSREQFKKIGPDALSRGLRTASGLVKKVGIGPLGELLEPTRKALDGFADQQQRLGKILGVFVPFTAEYHYIFRCDNTRAAIARLSGTDKARLGWAPEAIDWRQWFLEVHMPGLEKWVFPEIERRINKPLKAPRQHETLVALLDEMALRFDLAVALQRTEFDGLSRITFRDWRSLSQASAERLRQLGVKPADRVLLCGSNHPGWPIAFFGILMAGATAVPLDAAIEPEIAGNLLAASGAKLIICDAKVKQRLEGKLAGDVQFVDLVAQALAAAETRGKSLAVAPESQRVSPDDVAALIYTSGTTGRPKGVMLSHANLVALIASLAPLFPLEKQDRVLSVLPLHHTFELTCGMLLPLSRGARVIYLDELSADKLESTLKAGRITGLIGVPALWEMLERRIVKRVAEHGPLAARAFETAVEFNRALGRHLGVDAGRLLFGPVHRGLGGHLRFLVSGGAALPEDTHELFAGLGLHLAEGYGLTEAAPVLSVSAASPKSKPGQVGRAIPGVELRISDPNREGVGEVLARGPNVMLGYSDDAESTRRTIDEEGWLHTGDLGRVDEKGRLFIVGRAKDTIVTTNGENVYPDDVETRLGQVDHVLELCVLGVGERGKERIACAAVAEHDEALGAEERRTRARRSLERAIHELPPGMRPALVKVLDKPLPRTTTRKVKRAELARTLQGMLKPAVRAPAGDGSLSSVRRAVAAIARREPGSVAPELSLRGDLGFDSLMLLELLVALEAESGQTLDAERLSEAMSVGDVESLLGAASASGKVSGTRSIETAAEKPLVLPPALRDAAMSWMARAQSSFYDSVLRTKVFGRAYIPLNRNTLVVANHASHLDMGLVKHALGSYAQNMVTLAAQDYFFEGNRWSKAYFENLTNLVPVPRSGSVRQALRQAGDLLERGKTILIFPEGTRSTDGKIHEFKPLIGHLALQHRVDVLPVWLGGTHRALPKGASVLRHREVLARIGPPLVHSELRRLTEGLSPADAARVVATLSERAVRELRDTKLLDLGALTPEQAQASFRTVPPPTLEPVFKELKGRFRVGSVDQPISYYFSLGENERWTVRITKDTCEVAPGKVINPADCVLKTSPDIFTRIVREAYTPSPAEFMSGMVKSNNIGLLLTFQKAFQLQS